MKGPTRATAAVSPAARRALDRLHGKQLNFEMAGREPTKEDGWRIDDYTIELPAEPPGPPQPRGSFETARRLIADYEFADPSIVRAVYYADTPIDGRDMLLEARFYGLRFHLGVRVGGLVDGTVTIDGQPTRVWGWNYRTLKGHIEMGQMDYEIRKRLGTGEVEFRIHVVSKAAIIPNPLIRQGFAVFGRWMQRRFARNALTRMNRLVSRTLVDGSVPDADRSSDRIRVDRIDDGGET